MSDFFHKKGTLSVVIGQGWLSSFEAGSLKAGDVVRTGQLAGRPALLRYNGCEMGPCEVVIIGDLFGVRVTGTEPLGEVVPVPGTRDDLAELLPTEVVLGSIEVSPAELRGVGRNTIVSLGKPFSESADAELRAAGMPLARGQGGRDRGGDGHQDRRGAGPSVRGGGDPGVGIPARCEHAPEGQGLRFPKTRQVHEDRDRQHPRHPQPVPEEPPRPSPRRGRRAVRPAVPRRWSTSARSRKRCRSWRRREPSSCSRPRTSARDRPDRDPSRREPVRGVGQGAARGARHRPIPWRRRAGSSSTSSRECATTSTGSRC